jgi:hypothetical protein
MSRALLQLHLRKLEIAGLVSPALEFSEDGKAMKFYEVAIRVGAESRDSGRRRSNRDCHRQVNQ